MVGEHPSSCPDLQELPHLLRAEFGADVVRLALHQEQGSSASPRWFETCEQCLANFRTLERWQEEVGYPDLEVVVQERPRARHLWSELEALPTSRLKRVMGREHLFFAMASKLMAESYQSLAVSPGRGTALADLAVGVAAYLDEADYWAGSVMDLRVRAWAFLGNARRAAGLFRRAEDALATAVSFLPGGTGKPGIRALLFDFLGSLRKDQGRLDEADGALEQAALLYGECGQESLVGKIRLLQGNVAELSGRLDVAVQRFTEAQRMIDPNKDRVLFAHCQHHLVCYLVEVGQLDEALLRLPMARRMWRLLGNHYGLLRLRWAEGRLYQRLGYADEARMAFDEVQSHFQASESLVDCALLKLDQAVLCFEEGDLSAVSPLIGQAHALLSGAGRTVELAALAGLREAVQVKRVTRELIVQVASTIRNATKQSPPPP